MSIYILTHQTHWFFLHILVVFGFQKTMSTDFLPKNINFHIIHEMIDHLRFLLFLFETYLVLYKKGTILKQIRNCILGHLSKLIILIWSDHDKFAPLHNKSTTTKRIFSFPPFSLCIYMIYTLCSVIYIHYTAPPNTKLISCSDGQL